MNKSVTSMYVHVHMFIRDHLFLIELVPTICTCTYSYVILNGKCKCCYYFILIMLFYSMEDLEEQPREILQQSLLPGVK